MTIESQIAIIGNRLVACRLKCPGINLDPAKGIPPRCLYYETDNRSNELGVAIVGINPGIAKKHEMQYFLQNGTSYKQITKYWHNNLKERSKYYNELRNLVNQLGFAGNILWTELVKCQKIHNGRRFTIRNYPETFRACTKQYLQNEIKFIPKSWPLIAVGGETYRALAYLFIDRPIIGVPHPTGSYGHYRNMFSNRKLKKRFHISLNDIWDGSSGKAIWLSD